ncbi:MAG: DUF1553 domain-containing protein [Verrucomicrobia bacterium]|nr:DUF1553 domain-containing protein [Verrucomicrobiota bacterium]
MKFQFCKMLLCWSLSVAMTGRAAVDFNRDIRPILSDNCFACHGPDKGKRKAKLRLDLQAGATTDLGGRAAVVPGKPDQSEMIRRIHSTDPEEMMPPPDSLAKLSETQKQRLTAWIREGAPWADHWVFIPPRQSPFPKTKNRKWAQNQMDNFILSRLESEKLKPSPEADRRTLLRRLSFDLIGLPPTAEEVDKFLADKSPDAYGRSVERLLSSPHYGERMAVMWLDLVRYGDTVGIHGDQTQNIWPYRDYVINAFNQNKRFDQFSIEQLAGDLLPNATTEQKIASGFNRLNLTTEEGGAQDKEYLAKYASDRVRAVSTVWMAATLGCAECHDHKFDPYGTKDFYRMAAFFADIQEVGAYKGGNGSRPPEMPLPSPQQEARLKELESALAVAIHDLDVLKPKITEAQNDWEASLIAALDTGATKTPKVTEKIAKLLNVKPADRNKTQQQELTDWFARSRPEFAGTWSRHATLKTKLDQLKEEIPLTMISVSVEPRITRVLNRGDWMDTTGEVVEPGVPQYFNQLEHLNRRATRLDLARWIVATNNTMTARVFVNRLWKMYFGTGLSKVLDDLGSRGEWPIHPELLDFLALEFQNSGWDIKHVVRLIVTSATYRQSSLMRPELKERDPFNRLLARQSRFRLLAEMVRDNALRVSGLLVADVGGPSVKPYQPDGYWDYLNFPKRTYVADTGSGQYRRGVYTHWQRLFLHPMLKAFDAPSREECTAERPVSNTPLAALALLNDPTFVEAARSLAERALKQGGSESSRLDAIFRRALNRVPSSDEREQLRRLFVADLKDFEANPERAEKLLRTGLKPADAKANFPELAAWTSVCRAVLNLHETIVRF